VSEISAGTSTAPHVIVPSPLWQSGVLPYISPGGELCHDCLLVFSLSEASRATAGLAPGPGALYAADTWLCALSSPGRRGPGKDATGSVAVRGNSHRSSALARYERVHSRQRRARHERVARGKGVAPPRDSDCPLVITTLHEARDEPPDEPARWSRKDTNGITHSVNRHEESKAHRAGRWREMITSLHGISKSSISYDSIKSSRKSP
jgi:hypothetical protein